MISYIIFSEEKAKLSHSLYTLTAKSKSSSPIQEFIRLSKGTDPNNTDHITGLANVF